MRDVRPDRREAAQRDFGVETMPAFDEDLAAPADVVFVTFPSAFHMKVTLLAADRSHRERKVIRLQRKRRSELPVE